MNYHNQSRNLPSSVAEYLYKYASEKWFVQNNHEKEYENIIIVPAIAEYDNIKILLESINRCDKKYFEKTLLLFVINATESSDRTIKLENEKTLAYLKNRPANKLSIGFVDASTFGKEMPDKDGGVGLARKIGMDLALTLFNYSSNKKKLLICLDADCKVDENYLTAIVEEFNSHYLSAAYVNFEHRLPESEIERAAIICYEIFLWYYVVGLKYAESPYAFHTIGSTMICDYESYIKVGGMNKRKAGEDFYFLEKLAKVTSVVNIKSTKVYPSSRSSWRVPFGTGQRVNRFLSASQNEYLLYNPESFEILKWWLEVFHSNKNYDTSYFLNEAVNIHTDLKEFLEFNSFEKQWIKILKNAKTELQIQKQKLIWFDGFKTLKLIHFLRDKSFPQVNMFDALDKLFEMLNLQNEIERNGLIPTLPVQLDYLEVLRKCL